MRLFNRRSTIVLATVGAVGAIAVAATAASFALFYDPIAPQHVTFAAGNVTLNQASTHHCTFQNIAPGFSTQGYPGGDNSQPACTTDIQYTGSLAAFLSLDVTVTTGAGTGQTDTVACNGGSTSGMMSCAPLYNPGFASQKGVGSPLEVYVLANGDSYQGENGGTQAFGIGNDQTITDPGTVGVDTSYTGASTTGTAAKCVSTTGVDCPVQGGFKYLESYTVYAYWPLDENGDQNVYQNSWATVTLSEHAVQAADNALFSCSTIQDSQGLFGGANYYPPDQPEAGWGAGFSAGSSSMYPAIGSCPTIDSTTNGTDWTQSTPGSELLPFFHPAAS